MSDAAFTIDLAWRASVRVTSVAAGLNANVLGARRRQDGARGPVTPPAYWEARKVAIYVAVLAADCSYAQLARVLGMHKDTVSANCEAMRSRVIEEPLFERRIAVLEARARAALVPELLAMFDDVDRALRQNYELAGVAAPGYLETVRARVRRAATPRRRVPPGVRQGNVINFPCAEGVE